MCNLEGKKWNEFTSNAVLLSLKFFEIHPDYIVIYQYEHLMDITNSFSESNVHVQTVLFESLALVHDSVQRNIHI